MALSAHVIALIEELDRTHPGGVADWGLRGGGIPTFSTAENGQIRLFSPAALDELGAVTNILYETETGWKDATERTVFVGQLRQCVTDLHAQGLLANPRADDAKDARKKIRETLKERLASVASTYVHHIPCWTTAASPGKDFVMGPVTFRAVNDWIDWVDFQPRAYTMGTPEFQEANKDWRQRLKDSLATKQYDSKNNAEGFAGDLDKALSQCPVVATVTISGYESALSKKVAHAVCQAALDCISLALGRPDMFLYQILGMGRGEPFHWTSIVGTPAGLGFPGYSATRRFPRLDVPQSQSILALRGELLANEAAMLTALVQPTSHTHPELASRWLTALQWLAEGQREQDDAFAVAKLASSLDTLACGGKAGGITDMMAHLLGINRTDPLVTGPRGVLTLEKVISDVYDYGRSQILHGTHYERIKRFEELRQLALLLVPTALVETATRLAAYTGADSDKAFRTIPAVAKPAGGTP